MLTEELIRARLAEPLPVTVLDSTDSTNRVARELAAAGSGEQLVAARRQTGGRGRLGRSFFSPEGGLYMSLLLRPTLPAAQAIRITTAAAVAVCRAIDRIGGRESRIKWVNDVYLGERKICGILVESKLNQSGMLDWAVLGIGVNVIAPWEGFPSDIANRAGAIFPFGGAPEDAEALLAAEIVNEFMQIYRSNLSDSAFYDEYRTRSFLIGREVDVSPAIGGETRRATVVGIDDECRLVVQYADDGSEALSSGEVSARPIG